MESEEVFEAEDNQEAPKEQESGGLRMQACHSCGKFLTLQADSKQVYCSPECAQTFLRCPVCGRYFIKEMGAENFCSADCAEEHPEFDSLIFKELT